MSDLFGGHLVPSISIENMLQKKELILERCQGIIAQVLEMQEIAHGSGLGIPSFLVETAYRQNERRISGNHANERFEIMAIIRQHVDLCGWTNLMEKSGMRTFMDSKARADWDKSMRDGKFPPFELANIQATFEQLIGSRGDIFERGVIEMFKHLAWDYKTNRPFAFGKRIIVRGIQYADYAKHHPTHTPSFNTTACNQLDDLVRVFSVLDGKPEPDHRNGVYHTLSTESKERTLTCQDEFEMDYFRVRWYLNGNAHLTFTRPELVERMNAILTKHFQGALAHDKHVAPVPEVA